MAGVLYIVATPIGNLEDISPRAIAALRRVDVVAAEDTRHSRRLLQHLGIDTPLVSYHEHNEAARAQEIVRRLEAGHDVALISDAGTPLISDPGYRLVAAAQQAGIRVSPIPGPSSVTAALSVAGLPTDRFHFFGFLPSRASQRAARLQNLQGLHGTLVLLESSHRIEAMLKQLAEFFPRQTCVLAKELTKLHERILRGTAADILAELEKAPELARGEFVVLVDNPPDPEGERLNTDDVDLLEILLDEVSVKIAVRIAARLSGKNRNELYEQALRLRKNKPS